MESMVVQPGRGGKAEFRAAASARIAALDPQTRLAESRELSRRLREWLAGHPGATVLATLPLADEPDLTEALSAGLPRTRVALACTGQDSNLRFAYVTSFEGPWIRKGKLREPEPAELWSPGGETLCLVPGLAFAAYEGRVLRLGRGGGYYDRWLAEHGARVTTWGVGFSTQVFESLPVDGHDQSLDGWLIAGKP